MNETTKSVADAKHGGSTAIVPMGTTPMVLGSDAFRMGLEPTTLEEAFKLATLAASCKMCGVESSEDALMRIMTGRSLGLSAMQSLRGIYNVNGRSGIDAALMHAICLQSPLCEEFICLSSDEKQATYRAKRKGQPPQEWTFTIEDAERQGLVGRGDTAEKVKQNNYTKVPKDMLRARCKSTLARMVFPDLMFGLYDFEELGSVDPETGVRPGEMLGEIVRPNEKPSPVQAAKRDFAAEAAALIAEIASAGTTKEARTSIRKKIEAWDGVEPYRGHVVHAYNEAGKKPSGSAAASATPGLFDPNKAASPTTTDVPAPGTPTTEAGK